MVTTERTDAAFSPGIPRAGSKREPVQSCGDLIIRELAFLSIPRADPIDTLPADPPLHRSDNAGATPTLWIAGPAESLPIRRWYVLQNSAPRRATVSLRGKLHLSPLLLMSLYLCADI